MPTPKTLEFVNKVLSKISFVKSCVDMDWKWETQEIENGFLIRTTFQRPDVYKNGEIGTGFGRWMHIPKEVSEDGIVKTAWVCCELIVKHELMESFLYRKAKIFNPHRNLKDLAYPKELE